MGRMISNYFFQHGGFLCVIVRDEECLRIVCVTYPYKFLFLDFFSVL